jgi:hypothetical protein
VRLRAPLRPLTHVRRTPGPYSSAKPAAPVPSLGPGRESPSGRVLGQRVLGVTARSRQTVTTEVGPRWRSEVPGPSSCTASGRPSSGSGPASRGGSAGAAVGRDLPAVGEPARYQRRREPAARVAGPTGAGRARGGRGVAGSSPLAGENTGDGEEPRDVSDPRRLTSRRARRRTQPRGQLFRSLIRVVTIWSEACARSVSTCR